MIVVSSDADLKQVTQEQELRTLVGTLLAETYPGYRWLITAHAHPTKPFVDIQLEAGHAMFGATVKPWQFFSAASLKKEILNLGGGLLEAFHLNRRGLDEPEFISRKKNFAGIIMPDIAL